MTGGREDAGMQRYSTHGPAERRRVTELNDFVDRFVARREFMPVGGDVRVEIAALDLDGAVVALGRYSPIVGRRTSAHAADGHDDYLLSIHDADHEISVEGRPATRQRAGDMMLVSEACASEFSLPCVDVDVVSLRRARLARLVPGIDDAACHHVTADTPGVSLLRGYARLLRDHPCEAMRLGAAAATQLHELAAFALAQALRRDTGWTRRSLRATRLALVRKEIEARLCDPALSVATIARSQGISPRYVQQLFSDEGLTFSEFVRDCRLDLAYRLLASPDAGELRISTVAFDAGFGDLSHFNREFRRRFTMTPSDVRAQALARRRH